MSRPDDLLLALRPTIAGQPGPLPVPTTAADFQHRVWRPVLKLQHEVLAAVFEDFARDYRLPTPEVNATEAARLRAELLARNTRLRATLLGMALGLLTGPELACFHQHRAELTRRFFELLTVRLQA